LICALLALGDASVDRDLGQKNHVGNCFDLIHICAGKISTHVVDAHQEKSACTTKPMSGVREYRARYMDPVLGRFISEDPLGFDAGDFNVQRYVGNSPYGYFDPSGMVSSAEYAKFKSKVSLAVQDCIKSLGLEVVGNAATTGVYLFLAEAKIYAGRSIDTNRREKEHIRKKTINFAQGSFKVFHINADAYRNQLPKVRQLEQFLINLIDEEFDGKGTLNRRDEIKGGKSICGTVAGAAL
jgi:RHS repeat-associated protein